MLGCVQGVSHSTEGSHAAAFRFMNEGRAADGQRQPALHATLEYIPRACCGLAFESLVIRLCPKAASARFGSLWTYQLEPADKH